MIIDLYTIDDLANLEHEYSEHTFFNLWEGNITTIKNARKIKGSLFISNSNFQDFGVLEEIIGSLKVASICTKLKSLGNITKIEGDLDLKYSPIETLSKLKIVEGNISLKDSNIQDLGELEFVNGSLSLSNRMKNKFNFENIKIRKQIKYFADYKPPNNQNSSLLKSEKSVIKWEPGYIYSFEEINSANSAQMEFYHFFKEQFLNNQLIDLEGNNSYAFVLMFDLLKSLAETNNKYFEELLNQLAVNYYFTETYVHHELVLYFNSVKDYENGFKYYLTGNLIASEAIARYENLLKRNLFNPDIIIQLTGKSFLPEFGQRNIENIKPFIMRFFNEFEQIHATSFLNVFFDFPVLYKKFNLVHDNYPDFLKGYDPEYYKDFFLSEAEYEYYLQNDQFQINSGYERGIPNVVENAIKGQLRKFVLKSEDSYRVSIGLPKIGEGWIAETELYYKISNTFNLEIKHHGRPKWLGRQHLDIYIPSLNLAFEYQGIQHDKPIAFFGGVEGLLETKRRDELKRNKCRENGMTLIYVYPNYNFENIKQTIHRRILYQEK